MDVDCAVEGAVEGAGGAEEVTEVGMCGGIEGGCSVETTLLLPSNCPFDPTEPG